VKQNLWKVDGRQGSNPACGGMLRNEPRDVGKASSAALNLVDATDSVVSAIYYAELSGWLVGAGEPPQSVAITADGVRLLEECGLI
jgi:hypothetical protein